MSDLQVWILIASAFLCLVVVQMILAVRNKCSFREQVKASLKNVFDIISGGS